MTPWNWPTSKTPVWYKNLGDISYRGRVIANFVFKYPYFCYHGNRSPPRPGSSYNDSIKLADRRPQNGKKPLWHQNLGIISYGNRVIANTAVREPQCGESGSPLLLIQSPKRSSAIGGMFLYQQKILVITELHCKTVMFMAKWRKRKFYWQPNYLPDCKIPAP